MHCCSWRHHERTLRSLLRRATPPAEGRRLDSSILRNYATKQGHKPVRAWWWRCGWAVRREGEEGEAGGREGREGEEEGREGVLCQEKVQRMLRAVSTFLWAIVQSALCWQPPTQWRLQSPWRAVDLHCRCSCTHTERNSSQCLRLRSVILLEHIRHVANSATVPITRHVTV